MIANEEGGSYFKKTFPSFLECLKLRCLPYLDRHIPSILSYIEGEEYHGTQAKAQLVRNSKNTVAYFRDYLGKE